MEGSEMTNQELHAAWLAHPQVVAFDAAVAAHIKDNGLTGLDGMNKVLTFATEWQQANGWLPESGIKCG